MQVQYFNVKLMVTKCHLSILYLGQSILQRNKQDNAWTALPSPVPGVWSAAGVDHSIWSCNAAQEIYRWNGKWDKVPGACVQAREFFFCLHAHLPMLLSVIAFLLLD
jgi:hypothetical protein